MHAADVSSVALPLHQATGIIENVFKEFKNIGELQRAEGLDESFLCTKDVCIEKSQIGFIKCILPLFEALGEICPVGDIHTAIGHLIFNQMFFSIRVNSVSAFGSSLRLDLQDSFE